MQRHSTSDARQPESRTRHSSLFTRRSPLCIAFAALVAASASAAEVARFVEYIESDGVGNQAGEYILLDYTPASNSVVEADVAILDKAKTHTVFCSRSGGSSRTFTCFYVGNEGFRWDYNVTQNKSGKKISTDGERHTVRCSKTGFEYDGTLAKPSTPADFIPGNKMTLFASYMNQTAPTTPTPGDNFSKMKLYSFKAWDDDGATLKVDLYPCVDTDGTAALYDCVTRRLYYNLKSGTSFTASPTTVPPPSSFVKLDAAVAQTNGVWYATVAFGNGSGAVDLQVVSQQGTTNVVALSNGVATAPETFTVAIPGLAANTFYSVFASLSSGTSTTFTGVTNIFNGPVSVEVTANATPTTPGVFTVSRPAADGATNMPLTVAFTLSGTAVAGTHYLPIPETVTIPAGAASATVEVATLAQVTAATSLTLSLSGDNHLPGNPDAATMAVNSAFFSGDWFVAKDGDDQNSGASRAEAKATIPAAYACLTNIPAARVGNRLVICDGEWTSDDFGSTLVLSNGWTVVGEHGRGATTLRPVTESFVFFSLKSEDAGVSGITFNFNNIDYKTAAFAITVGTMEDCDFLNMKNTSCAARPAVITFSGSGRKTLRNCVFRYCSLVCNSAVVYALDSSTRNFLLDRCQFIDCTSGTANSYGGAAIIHGYQAAGTIRNCLFLRNVVYGASSAYAAGGIVSCNSYGANFTVENCTFAENRIFRNGEAGVVGNRSTSSLPGTITIRNCLAWGNSNTNGPVGIVTRVGTVANCAADVETATGTDNVLLTADNTTFREARDGRYIPLSGPALNGGASLDWMPGASDLLGKTRVIGEAPDIGCFENDFVEPRTYYVAKDGDDANSGLTRAEAKATIPAGYALLSDYDETLVIGDGEWEVGLDPTFVLSNGWTVCSENGAGATTLKFNPSLRAVQNSTDLDVAHSLFDLKTPASTVSGFTIDLSNVNMCYVSGALLKLNSTGVLTGCIVRNFYTSWEGSLIRIADKKCHLDISDCTFTNFYYTYWTAALWLRSGGATIENCRFTDCHAMAKTGTKYFNYGVVYFDENQKASTLRNSLFLRCSACGSSGSYHSSVVAVRNTANARLENCSFINCLIYNTNGGGAAGGLQLSSTGSTAVNCFAYGNSTGVAQSNLVAGLTYSYCASDIALEGEGNVVLTDTNFNCARAGRGDHTPTRGPTLDAGVLLPWMTGAKDILGRERVVGAAPDIGCFEYDNRAATRLLLR